MYIITGYKSIELVFYVIKIYFTHIFDIDIVYRYLVHKYLLRMLRNAYEYYNLFSGNIYAAYQAWSIFIYLSYSTWMHTNPISGYSGNIYIEYPFTILVSYLRILLITFGIQFYRVWTEYSDIRKYKATFLT